MKRQEAVAEQERLFPRRLMREYLDTKTPHPDNHYTLIPPNLAAICLDLRAALNGSADPWPKSAVREVRDMLRARIDTWDPTTSKSFLDHTFDGAVRLMVIATVGLANNWLRQEEEDGFVTSLIVEVV